METTMHKTDTPPSSLQDQRIIELEARITWLEAAVAQLIGEPPARRLPTSVENKAAGKPFEIDLSMARTQPLSQVVQPAAIFTGGQHESMGSILDNMGITAPLVCLETAPNSVVAGAPSPEIQSKSIMGITAAFASLDAKVAEAGEAECMIAPIKRSSAPVLEIDPDLIDRPAVKPRTVRLDVHALIEDQYPSILQKITAIWRTPEARGYLQKLIVDDRGDRNGFDPGVMSELLMLSALLEDPFQISARKPGLQTH